jgi:hypothetical protein
MLLQLLHLLLCLLDSLVLPCMLRLRFHWQWF